MAKTFEVPAMDDLLDNENVEIISDPDFYKVETEGEDSPPVQESTYDPAGENVQEEEVDVNDAPEQVEEDPTAVGTYKTLLDKGYITDRDDFDGTFEKLDEIFEEIPESVKNNLLSNTNEKGKQIMEYIMNKGHELTDQDVVGFLNLYNQPVSVDSLEGAREIVSNHLKAQGLDDDLIESNIDLLESRDEEGEALKELASKYQRASQTTPDEILEQQRLQEMEQQEAQREFTTSLYDTIDNNKFPKRTKEAVKANYRSNAYVERFTEAFTNPESLVQLITLSQYYDAKTKTFDLTEFAKVAASKQVEKLKDNSIRQNYSSSSRKSSGTKRNKNLMDDVQFVNP